MTLSIWIRIRNTGFNNIKLFLKKNGKKQNVFPHNSPFKKVGNTKGRQIYLPIISGINVTWLSSAHSGHEAGLV